jgi:4-aminobutyrate aminotransferase-like enzyme/Ser/Thr protein kinase RdoA (MazF antagonist)
MTAADAQFALRALQDAFGLEATLSPLPGEHDLNYSAVAAEGPAAGTRYLFKIHGAEVAPARLEMQAAVLRHLELIAPELPLPRLYLSRDGQSLPTAIDASGRPRRLRLTTWLDGDTWVASPRRGPAAAASLGALLARLDRGLVGFHHAAAGEPYAWDLARAAERLPDAAVIADAEQRNVAIEILQRFARTIAPRLADLPKQVIHADANDRNVLLDADGAVSGLIDFGDMVESWRVNEVAVAATYLAIGTHDAPVADPIGAMLPLIAAYHAVSPLGDTEADVLFDLVLTRCAVSMAMAARQIRAQPGNAYLLVSQEDIWRGLRALRGVNRPLAIARIRKACGCEPVATRRAIEHWILMHGPDFGPVLPLPLGRDDITVLPLGADCDPEGRGIPYAERVATLRAAVPGTAISRYGEDRGLYATAPEQPGSRVIHTGIDLFAPAGTPVLAPMPGRVAMIGNETGPGGFGGILVLEHAAGAHVFWTMVGHLAPGSLARHALGDPIEKGAVLGLLGDTAENGGWPPHLHLQLMTALCFDRAEAIYGAVTRVDWDLWESILPDPSGILGLPVSASAVVARSPEGLLALRRQRLSSAQSLSYDAPLKIVGGSGATLVAADGRRYLDMVNNVCHVGHQHPRVVAAIQEQAARLNTNTRYLHDNLVEYAQRLTRLLPPELSTIFLVNSGSEANDLALRLAAAYTGGTEVMVLDHAYHGHLTSLIEISPYKFDGPGGAGRPRHTWVAEMPDLYRGRIRYGEPDAATRYAERLSTLLRDMGGLNRRISAFFVEALLGCGGQLVLPEGYLTEAFAAVRAAGGVCVADEVQIGFGRIGSGFWAFESQSGSDGAVVPDIVTMGKPIGNGHPMGAVACRPEIAAAFANGMEYFNTFGGNPVSAAAALAVLDVIRDERLVPHAVAMGQRLTDALTSLAQRHALIGDVRGIGLFMGVELVRDRETLEPAARETKAIIEAMKAEGILLSSEGQHHNVLKIKPPLAITAAECDRFVETLDGVMAKLT